MSKLSNFLHLKIYRRTFLLYLLIVLVFVTAIIFMFYRNMVSGGLADYAGEVEARFSQAELQIQLVADAIDSFFTHLYASNSLLEDFFAFFGATPVEYAQARLDTDSPLYETYLSNCENLIASSGYTIRHILYYSTANIVDMEYSSAGYSRYRTVTPDEAEALCHTGFTYAKDIHRSSSYVGKVCFILDISIPVSNAFGNGVCLVSNGSFLPLGQAQGLNLDWQRLLDSGLGRTNAGGQNLVYCARVSDQFSYSIIAVAPAATYFADRFNQFLLFSFGLILVFILITMLYARQFSSDSTFIQSILRSVVSAQSEQFVPVKVGRRKDEFADIANHLNNLYSYLDTLIQQKYLLTIRQQQTEMQRLSAQLNPHFLYNTLERIRLRALAEGSPTVAEAIADLGQVYRNIVKTEPIITMGKELDITRQYLDLMCFLYGDRFLYHCDIPDSMVTFQTPKIWMQPIVENFFKHNFQNDDQLKVVVISGEETPGGYRLRFFGNAGHISEEQIARLNQQFVPDSTEAPVDSGSGIGLKNVYERLRLYYGSRVKMSIHNQRPAGVCIQVLLTIEVKNDHVPPAHRG